MRALLAALFTLALALPAHAQHAAHDPDNKVSGAALPAGWQARVDRDQPADRVKFVTMGKGYHATMGPAAVFYNPAWSKSGNYQVAASFTQTKAPAHPEAYGIVIGGKNLSGADQAYTYFLVRGTGEYFIATRRGADRTVVVNWTAHPAILKQDPQTGRAANVLGAEVRGSEVVFSVNGVEVTRRPKSEILADGLFGFRVNHDLDVHIDQVAN